MWGSNLLHLLLQSYSSKYVSLSCWQIYCHNNVNNYLTGPVNTRMKYQTWFLRAWGSYHSMTNFTQIFFWKSKLKQTRHWQLCFITPILTEKCICLIIFNHFPSRPLFTHWSLYLSASTHWHPVIIMWSWREKVKLMQTNLRNEEHFCWTESLQTRNTICFQRTTSRSTTMLSLFCCFFPLFFLVIFTVMLYFEVTQWHLLK